MIRIIANKKIDLTEQEWAEYNKIIASYDSKLDPKLYFHDLFESGRDGIITQLKAPSQVITFEIYLFIVNVFLAQHVREMYKRLETGLKEIKENTKKD